MKSTSATIAFSASVLAAGLLAAPASFAASVEGYEFTVKVTESSLPIFGQESGIAGSAGRDVDFDVDGLTVEVEWVDGDTFKLDWYMSGAEPLDDLTFALMDLNFADGGTPHRITGVTQVSVDPAFDWAKDVTFTDNSITIAYAALDTFEVADGSNPTFDVSTSVVPVPAALPLLASGLGLMALVGARGRRKQHQKA